MAQGKLLEDREVDVGLPQLLFEHLTGIVEQRPAAIEHGRAHQLAQRAAPAEIPQIAGHAARDRVARDLRRGHPLRDERRGLREGQRRHQQRGEPPAQRAPLGEHTLHLRDQRAAQHESGLRVLALLLHHRLDRGQGRRPVRLGGRQQVGKLVDHRQHPVLRAKPIEQPQQAWHVGDLRTQPERRLERRRELRQLRTLGHTLRDEQDRRLAVREPAQQPGLANASPTVERQGVAIPTPVPLLHARQIISAVEELLVQGPLVKHIL